MHQNKIKILFGFEKCQMNSYKKSTYKSGTREFEPNQLDLTSLVKYLNLKIENDSEDEVTFCLKKINRILKKNVNVELPYEIMAKLMRYVVGKNECIVVETLRLIKNVFSYDSNSLTRSLLELDLIDYLVKFLGNDNNLEEEALKCICNISGGTVEERNHVINTLNFDVFNKLILNSFSNRFYYCRILRNICLYKIGEDYCKYILILISKLYSSCCIKSQIELLWSIFHLKDYYSAWNSSIEELNLLTFFKLCLNINYPELTRISLNCIFHYIQESNTEMFIDFNFFFDLIKSDSLDNKLIGFWGIDEIITIDDKYVQVFLNLNILNIILDMFQNSDFDTKSEAIYLLCTFIISHEILNFVINNDIISELVHFLEISDDKDLVLHILQAIYSIFSYSSTKFEFEFILSCIQETGISLIQELSLDDNEDIASCSSIILSNYIDKIIN